MSKCGWCKKPELKLVADGSLEQHTVPSSGQQCYGLVTYRQIDESPAPQWHQMP